MEINRWGQRGHEDGQFIDPVGIGVGVDGMIYVADSGNHRVQVFNFEGTFVRKWGSYGDGEGKLSLPNGVAVEVDEGIKESIQRAVCQVPELSTFPPGLIPICIAYVGKELVYVANRGNGFVQSFTGEGQLVQVYRCPLGVHSLNTCAVIKDAVYASDMLVPYLHVWKTGSEVQTHGNRILYPGGIGIDRQNQLLYVTNPHSNRILQLQTDGTQIGELEVDSVPTHIACTDRRHVYVAHADGTIRVYRPKSKISFDMTLDTIIDIKGSTKYGQIGGIVISNTKLLVTDRTSHEVVILNLDEVSTRSNKRRRVEHP